MAHLLLACPQCHAAYKLAKEHAQTEVVCRSCGHRWVPAHAEAAPAAPAPEPPPPAPESSPAPESPPPAPEPAAPPAPAQSPKLEGHIGSPLDALAAMAKAGRSAPAPPADASPVAEPPKPSAKPAPASALEAMAQAAQGAAKAAPARADSQAARAEKPDPLVGTRLNGFRIQSRIGSGGFGVVYKAFDTNLERSVAVKVLPPNIAKAGRGLVERFLREARSAAKLAHPNIVTIHQICPHKDTYYIVMELVDGGALHEHLAARKRFSPAEATRIVRAAAEGLGHAHKRGIIHRDIKPGNIMMTSDGQVKVSDFGLARDVLQGQDIVGSGHSLGTPRYMAPEQALGEEPTASSDLYSLAATYYALLTGRAPFDGANDRDIMKKHVQVPVPDPRQFLPDMPVAVYRFFEKAMAKQPEERFVTAEEFIAALDRLDFSKADGATPNSQDLINQLGAISAEDRGSHLTQALGRAVRRAQRQRTPMPERVVENMLGAGTGVRRKTGWKLWLIIGIVLVVVIAGAIVAAIMLAPGGLDLIRPGGTPVTPGPAPSGETPTPSGETPKPSGETPTPSGETPSPSGETPKPSGETPITYKDLTFHCTFNIGVLKSHSC